MAAAMIIGAIAGGLANGITTHYQTKKLANEYKKYAGSIRDAAEKYSGKKADDAMTMAGEIQGRQSTQRAMDRAMNKANGSNLSMQNALANDNSANAINAMQEGQTLGRNLKANDLNAAYNAATIDAQNALNRGKKDYQLGQAATGLVTGLAGNVASLGGNALGGLKLGAGGGGEAFGTDAANAVGAANLTSDENAKEGYHNHSGLPRADAEDALRQIESVSYKYKPETGLDQDKHVGVVAQSVQGTAFDDAVKKDGKYLALDKQKLLESTLAGCAALQKEIDELKSNNKTMTSDEACKAPIGDIYHGNYKQKAKQVENAIEANPVEAAAELPEGSAIQKEAEQAIDGGRDAEVNNAVVEEAVKKEPGSFINRLGEDDWLSFGKKQKRTRAEAKQAKQDALDDLDRLSTADMREIAEMGGTANPYSPDLSSSNPSAYGDDYKALAETVGNIIDGQQDATQDDALPPAVIDASLPVDSDTSEYNFDWAYEVLPDEEKEEFAGVPDEEKEDWLKLHGFTIGGGGPVETPAAMPSAESNVELNNNNNNRTPGTSFGKIFDMSSSSANVSSPSVSSKVDESAKYKDGKSNIHGSADLPDTPNESAASVIGAKQGNENNGNLTANGVYNSGSVNHTGSSLKAKLPSGESRGADSNIIDLQEATIENIKRRVAELPVGLAEGLGFTDTTYKGIKYEDADLNEADKVLSNLGV